MVILTLEIIRRESLMDRVFIGGHQVLVTKVSSFKVASTDGVGGFLR